MINRTRHPLHDLINLMVAGWIYPSSITADTVSFPVLSRDEQKYIERRLEGPWVIHYGPQRKAGAPLTIAPKGRKI